MSSGPILSCRNVHKAFALGVHTIDVLKGISLDVQQGESLAVMGRSGAGKSTLLHVLGGLESPDQGTVSIHGHALAELGQRKRSTQRAHEVGFVFQAYHLLPELTILENVALPALASPGLDSHPHRRAAELLDRVGLSERIEHKPRELSGGEQQRAAIARALMNRPSLLLADEPTGNLDSKTGDTVLHHLFDLLEPRDGEEQVTLVMVTHNAEVAARCSRTVHLRDGLLEG